VGGHLPNSPSLREISGKRPWDPWGGGRGGSSAEIKICVYFHLLTNTVYDQRWFVMYPQ